MRNTSLTLALLACSIGAVAAAQTPTIKVDKDNRTIAITATDTAEAIADQAVVTVGYLDYGADESSAYANGSRRSNAIVAALEKSGMAKNTIESMDQQLEPLNEFEIKNLKAEQKNFRYRIQQNWTVKTTPEQASKVLDAAVKAGANQSGNIAWQMKDNDALEARAAEKAIAHAQRIAAQMAAGLKIHLGPLVYASNQQSEAPVRPLNFVRMSAGVMSKQAEPLAITSRHITVSATVYAVFAVTD